MTLPRGLTIACFLTLAGIAVGQTNDAQPDNSLLGERTRAIYDVSFRPFADAKKADKASENELLRFKRDDKKWTLAFERAELQKPMPLSDTTDVTGVAMPGYLSVLTASLKNSEARADILATDILDLGQMRIGIITATTRTTSEPGLLQQAVIEVSPKLYYAVTMTSPAPEKAVEDDAGVKEAVATFKAITDSIEPVDLSKLRVDQEQRLFRTRALFVEWNRQKLLATLRPEQLLRYRKQGRDVGYAYVVEQVADALPRDGELAKPLTLDPAKAAGIRVGTRSRSVDDTGKAFDLESWMFVSFDRRNEVWSNVTVVRDPKAASEKLKEAWFSEVGSSDMQKERVFDKAMNAKDFKDADKQEKLPFDLVDKYRLQVRTESKNAVAQPLKRDLPPFYIPQALSWMLPRLVPLNIPTGYLFAVYHGPSRQVMLRYVDVGPETDVTLAGKTQRAVPVIERLGLDGGASTHYFTSKGVFLGTVVADSDVEITPTDRATLDGIWKDNNLNAPGAVRVDAAK